MWLFVVKVLMVKNELTNFEELLLMLHQHSKLQRMVYIYIYVSSYHQKFNNIISMITVSSDLTQQDVMLFSIIQIAD